MKNTIIHPTDFSECANKALDYAVVIAKALKFKLRIVHLLDHKDINSFNSLEIIDQIEKTEKEAEKELKKIKEKVKGEQVECETEVNPGKMDLFFPQYILEQSPELVVMGTTGNNKLGNKLMGSNTHSIINNTEFPILAVPKNTVLKKEFRKLLFLSDYRDKDIDAIDFISKIALAFKAKVNVVHILDNETKKKVNNQKLLDKLKDSVQKRNNYSNVEYQLLINDDIEQRVRLLLEESKPDLLAVIMRRQNFFERLFFGSLTKKMVYQDFTPLLVFKEEK